MSDDMDRVQTQIELLAEAIEAGWHGKQDAMRACLANVRRLALPPSALAPQDGDGTMGAYNRGELEGIQKCFDVLEGELERFGEESITKQAYAARYARDLLKSRGLVGDRASLPSDHGEAIPPAELRQPSPYSEPVDMSTMPPMQSTPTGRLISATVKTFNTFSIPSSVVPEGTVTAWALRRKSDGDWVMRGGGKVADLRRAALHEYEPSCDGPIGADFEAVKVYISTSSFPSPDRVAKLEALREAMVTYYDTAKGYNAPGFKWREKNAFAPGWQVVIDALRFLEAVEP